MGPAAFEQTEPQWNPLLDCDVRAAWVGSYEGQRMRRSLTQTFSVPTLEMRAGDFAGEDTICDPLAGTPQPP